MLALENRYFRLTVFVLAFFLCTFCAAAEKSPLKVAVTLAPYAKIVQEVAGENARTVILVPPGANPHTFEPRPNTLREFSDAALYLSDGSGLDAAWRPRFLGVNPKVRIVDISLGISWLKEEEHGHDRHDDEAEGLDPHIWNSPRQAILVASNLCSALAEIDAANAGTYRANLEKFSRKMSDLDVFISEKVKGLAEGERSFIVFHPSYGYLARDYGLVQVPVEMHGKEPKPRDLKHLVEVAKREKIRTVFVQPQFSRRAVESLSREIRANVVTIDPVAFDFDVELRRFVEAVAGRNP